MPSILNESHQITYRHMAAVDAKTAEPDDSDAGEIQNEHHDRHQRSHDSVDLDGCIGQVLVGMIEAGLLLGDSV